MSLAIRSSANYRPWWVRCLLKFTKMRCCFSDNPILMFISPSALKLQARHLSLENNIKQPIPWDTSSHGWGTTFQTKGFWKKSTTGWHKDRITYLHTKSSLRSILLFWLFPSLFLIVIVLRTRSIKIEVKKKHLDCHLN